MNKSTKWLPTMITGWSPAETIYNNFVRGLKTTHHAGCNRST